MKRITKSVTVNELAREILAPEIEKKLTDVRFEVDIEKSNHICYFEPAVLKIGKKYLKIQLNGLHLVITLLIIGIGSIIINLLLHN